MSSIFLRSLRCVARGPGRLQFSTKVPVANDNTPSTGPKTPDPNLDDFKELAEYLQGEEGGARTLDRDVPSGKWKGFRPNSFIKPHQLTYKDRAKVTPTRFKPYLVPPPAREARYKDIFHQLDIDPLTQAMNPGVLAGYMSEMGKIYGRNHTFLTTKSQRRLSKAIRRARMMGIIPQLSKPGKFSLMDKYFGV